MQHFKTCTYNPELNGKMTEQMNHCKLCSRYLVEGTYENEGME